MLLPVGPTLGSKHVTKMDGMHGCTCPLVKLKGGREGGGERERGGREGGRGEREREREREGGREGGRE